MSRRLALVTGGCGFIGVNAAARLLERGWRVRVFDDLSRRGTERNLRWLKGRGPVEVKVGDIRDAGAVRRWTRSAGRADLALHLSGQVAVTSSVADPRRDFEVNALGGLNFLEALRALERPPVAVYSSTNKVYGGMEDVGIRLVRGRYAYARLPHGVPEGRPLDFHSPYGCSKGAADQYFRDYARIYGMRTVVLRQSCIYGPHQHGNEDQGWVAHFMKRALAGRGVTLYGDGRQVRDVLFIDDLLDLFDACARRPAAHGRVFNVGGGPANSISLLELIAWIERRLGRRVPVARRGWRPGDQRVYVSDVRAARRVLGWAPRVGVEEGLERLWGWLSSHG